MNIDMNCLKMTLGLERALDTINLTKERINFSGRILTRHVDNSMLAIVAISFLLY